MCVGGGGCPYCKVLWSEATKATKTREVSPRGGAVELLHLLQLLLQAPLLLVFLRVGKFHHHGRGAALRSTKQNKPKKKKPKHPPFSTDKKNNTKHTTLDPLLPWLPEMTQGCAEMGGGLVVFKTKSSTLMNQQNGTCGYVRIV